MLWPTINESWRKCTTVLQWLLSFNLPKPVLLVSVRLYFRFPGSATMCRERFFEVVEPPINLNPGKSIGLSWKRGFNHVLLACKQDTFTLKKSLQQETCWPLLCTWSNSYCLLPVYRFCLAEIPCKSFRKECEYFLFLTTKSSITETP